MHTKFGEILSHLQCGNTLCEKTEHSYVTHGT